MAFSSVFSRPWSPTRSTQPAPEYELRLLSDEQRSGRAPMAFAAAASHIFGPTMAAQGRAPAQRSLSFLEQRERQLQRHLQTLLDAQGDGLQTGLSQGVADETDTESHGRSTPTASVRQGGGPRTVPVRQPPPETIGLRAARRGILETMRELAAIKRDEESVVEDEVRAHEDWLRQMDEWERRRRELDRSIDQIKKTDEGGAVERLSEQEKRLRTEIGELETRLFQAKARHRQVTSELAQVENSVQAKLSSYQAALADLDAQIRSFLAQPPVVAGAAKDPARTSFLALPVGRRTLAMARDQWEAERCQRMEDRAQLQRELDALGEGMHVWAEVVREVGAFERRIRKDMRAAAATVGEAGSDGAAARMDKLLRDMDRSLARLEERLALAEQRDWKLLLCCIGAEVEAFREGRAMLQQALRHVTTSTATGRGQQVVAAGASTDRATTAAPSDAADEPDRAQSELRSSADRFHDAVEKSPWHDDDQDPDPELLISQPEPD